MDFGKAAKDVNTFNQNLKEVNVNLSTIQNKVREVSKKIPEALNFGDVLGKKVQFGIETGIAHAIGAISVGANPLTALPHEIIRNISISVFHTLLSTFKQTGEAAKGAAEDISKVGEAVSTAAGEARKSGDFFDSLGKQTSTLGAVFNAIEFKTAAFGIGLVLIGTLLDNLGDKFTALTLSLSKAAGDAGLSFIQLDAVIKSTGESLGVNLGSIDKWTKTIKDLSIQSGRSQKDLADLGIAFTAVGADAGLSGKDIQKLVEIAAFTADRFRNTTEQSTNLRQALAGNTRFLANNIPIGNTLAEVTAKVTDRYIAQGKTQKEATDIVSQLSTAQKVLIALQEASEPIIKTAKETTGNYALELRKLIGTLDNLKIAFGETIQGPVAAATAKLRQLLQELTNIPKPIQQVAGTFLLVSNVVTEVGGKLLKLAGYILTAVAAWVSLNKILNLNLLATGSVFGAFSTYATKITGLETSVNSLSGAFKVLINYIKQLAAPFTSISGISKTFTAGLFSAATYTRALSIAVTALGIAFSAFKIGAFLLLLEAFSTIVDKLSKTNIELGITDSILATLNDLFGTTAKSIAEFTKQLGLSDRVAATFNVTASVMAQAMRGIAFAAALAAQEKFSKAAEQAEKNARSLQESGNFAKAKEQIEFAKQQNAKALEYSKILERIQEGVNKENTSIETNSTVMFGNTEHLHNLTAAQKGAALGADILTDSISRLNEKLSEEQLSELEKALKSLRGQVDQFRIRRIELISGPEAAQQAKDLLKLKEIARGLINDKKGGARFITDEEINNAKTEEDILGRLAKVKGGGEEKAKELRDVLALTKAEEAGLKLLEQRKKLFADTINSIRGLGEAFNKEIKNLQAEVNLQNQFNDSILASTSDFDELVRKAQLERDVRKSTLDIDNRIAVIRDKIQNGKVEVTALGITEKVELSPKEKAKAEQELANLTKDKTILIRLGIEEATAKRVGDIIAEFQKKGEALAKTFNDDTKQLRDQGNLLEKFTEDLAKGTKFAEDNLAVRTKELELTNKLKDAQNDLNDLTTLLLDIENNLKPAQIAQLELLKLIREKQLARLQIQKDTNVETIKENQIREKQKELALFLKKQTEELQDQLKLLEERAKLFEEGVLQGDFNKSAERVSVLTSELDKLLSKQIELQRQREENSEIIPQEAVDKVKARIEEVKKALKAANFINDIRELLQTIPDAIGEALNEGVKAVFAGTLKISQLFKNMAQNILLSLSKIFANRALKGIGDQLDGLAEKIAKSDIGRKIAAAIGIPDVDAAFKKPEDLLKSATEKNTLSQDRNTVAIDNLTTTLGGITGNKPITNNGIPLPTEAPLPPIDFEKVAQQITDGTATLEVISEKEFAKLWQDLTGQIQFGLQGAATTFQDAGKIIEENITSVDFKAIAQSITEGTASLEVIPANLTNILSGFDTQASFMEDITSAVTKAQDDLAYALANGTSLLGNKFDTLGTEITDSVANLIPDNLIGGDLFAPLDDIFISEFDNISNLADTGLKSFVETIKTGTQTGLADCLGVAEFSFSDFFRGIEDFFTKGFNGIGNLFSGVFKTPKATSETIFKTAVEVFRIAVDKFAAAIGLPKVATPTIPTGQITLPNINTPLPPDQLPTGTPQDILTDFSSSEIFDQFSKDFVQGFQTAMESINAAVDPIINGLGTNLTQNLNEVFSSSEIFDQFSQDFVSGFEQISGTVTSGTDDILGSLGSGFDSLLNSASSGFGSLFSSLGSLLQNGLSSLTGGLGGFDFGSIFSGIGSFFGFAEGGIIGGTPSKKDDKLVPMRSGEGVITPEATAYYGGKDFIDSINNMALPDFFSGLQEASAPAQFAGIASRATNTPAQYLSRDTTNTNNKQSDEKSNQDNERSVYVTVINKGPVVDPAHFKMKPSEVTEIVVNGIRKDKALRRVINENSQLSKGGGF